MRTTHMHHPSSWFLVCETFHERRRRHPRDHGWPRAADTPSSFFSFFGGKLTKERLGRAMSEASRTPMTIMPNTRTRQRFNRTRNRELEIHKRTRATPRAHARSTCENATLARLPERDARAFRERLTQPTHTKPPETPPQTTDYTYRHTGNTDAPRDRTRTVVAPRPSPSHDHTRPRVHTNTSQTI